MISTRGAEGEGGTHQRCFQGIGNGQRNAGLRTLPSSTVQWVHQNFTCSPVTGLVKQAKRAGKGGKGWRHWIGMEVNQANEQRSEEG